MANALVCKTSIHGFKSHSVLQQNKRLIHVFGAENPVTITIIKNILVLEFACEDTVKITRNRYQQGSIRKVPRANGFAWEYRYYVTSGGKRKLKMQAVGPGHPLQ